MHLTPSHPKQGFLSFIPQLEVLSRQQRWEEKEKKHRYLRIERHSEKPMFDLDLLDLPLFKSNKVFDDILDGDPFVEEGELIVEDANVHLDSQESFEWSEVAVVDMHYNLLKRSMERLVARNNAAEKQEILDWIFNANVPDDVIRMIDGKRELILIPFTFGACCRLEGCDPDEMREKIETICRENGIVIH